MTVLLLSHLVLAVRDRSSDSKFFADSVKLRRRGHRQVREGGKWVASGLRRHVGCGRREVRDGLNRASGVGEPEPGPEHLVEYVRLAGGRHNHLETNQVKRLVKESHKSVVGTVEPR